MSDGNALSGDDLAALFSELGVEEEAAAAPAAPAAAGPQPFTFGADGSRAPLGALPALDRMNERLTRRLRDLVEAFSRQKPRVTAEPTAVRRFESWRLEQPSFTSLSLYRFQPLKGAVLLAIEPELISRLVDAFYGGNGAPPAARAREFTSGEERLLARLADALMDGLAELWSEILPAGHQLVLRESNIAHAAPVQPEDSVVVVSFTVSLPSGRASPIHILYPAAALRAVESALAPKLPDDAPPPGCTWRERLGEALGDVRLEARSVLARPSLSVDELLRLSPGDVIPISLPAQVPLLVSGRPLAHGQIGEQDGRAALMVERVETPHQNGSKLTGR